MYNCHHTHECRKSWQKNNPNNNEKKTLLISAFIFRQTAKGLETVHADLHFTGYKSATNYSRLKSGRENLQPGTIMAAAHLVTIR